jgi:hypothetical protein
MSDPRSKEKEESTQPLTQSPKTDINDAFDSITLNCFDEYKKPKEEPQSTIPKKQENPYKSKKNKKKYKDK